MLLAHELVFNAAVDGDMPIPDVIVDVSDVEEIVRLSRAKLPHAPGDNLPAPEASHMPWESAVYEHPLEGEHGGRRNIYASQENSIDGQYHLTMTVVDMAVVDDQLDVTYYGACTVALSADGVLVGYERGPNGDAHEVPIEDGALLEMLLPALVANHLVNTGVVGAATVVPSERAIFEYSSSRFIQA